MNRNQSEEQNIFIMKGNHVRYRSGIFKISCIAGIVWLTWPGSGDVILYEGDSISVNINGMLCLTAFKDSDVIIKKDFTPRFKFISRFVTGNYLPGFIAGMVKGEPESVLSDQKLI